MKITRRGFLKAIGGAVAGVGITAVSGYTYSTRIEPEWLMVESVQIPLPGLKPALEGFKIVQLSDFHLYPFTQIELVQEAVQLANGLKPDLVVLTGDFVLATADSIFELAPVLAGLDGKQGVFAILGNHEWWTNPFVVQQGLQESGLTVLQNRGVSLPVGQETLYLAGVDDCWSGQPDLAAALDGLKGGETAVLLAHEPDFADEFAQNGRIALQLSGHSHGGQVRIPGRGAPILPRYGQKYDMGLNKVAGMWVYTTRGIGVVDPPVRFNCPPEVTEITLVKA
jgi:hypothetical protein